MHLNDDDIRNPSKINGIFLYFPSSTPTNKLLSEGDKVLLVTPNGPWYPKIDVCSRSEENMLDCKGDIVEQKE